MTAPATQADELRDQLKQRSEQLAIEAPEMRPLRAVARLDLLPTGKLEAFKYTPIEALYAPLLNPPTRDIDQAPDQLRTPGVGLLPVAPSQNALPEGLQRQSLADAFAEPHALNADVDSQRYPLTHLNTALLQSGYLIRVADGCRPATPLRLDWADLGDPGCSRVILDIGPNARVELIESLTPGAPANCILELRIAAGASLTHVRWQPRSDRAVWSLSSTTIATDASYQLNTYALGGGPHRNDYHVRLQGRGATFDLNGAHLAYGTDRLDQQVVVEHQAPDGRSSQTLSGIGAGKSRLSFNGRIHIHPGAQRSDARLTNKNLQLNNTSQINTKPELEIYADDVKCAHGATVGQLDEAAVFYLRSRGIDLATARHMLIRGFIHDRLPVGELGEELAALLDGELSALDAPAGEST